jgi:hypothetical protein
MYRNEMGYLGRQAILPVFKTKGTLFHDFHGETVAPGFPDPIRANLEDLIPQRYTLHICPTAQALGTLDV